MIFNYLYVHHLAMMNDGCRRHELHDGLGAEIQGLLSRNGWLEEATERLGACARFRPARSALNKLFLDGA